MKADTVIEEQATNAQGRLRFEADLPVGYTYYIKETAPAPGFSMTGERKNLLLIQKAVRKRVYLMNLLLRMYRQW